MNRKIDWGFIIQLITIAGALYVILIKPTAWDETTHRVELMEPKVERVAILEERLNGIDKKIDLVIELERRK